MDEPTQLTKYGEEKSEIKYTRMYILETPKGAISFGLILTTVKLCRRIDAVGAS